MGDLDKSKKELIRELEELRLRVTNLDERGVQSKQDLATSKELLRLRTGELSDESERGIQSKHDLATSNELLRVRTVEFSDKSDNWIQLGQKKDELHRDDLLRYATKLEISNRDLQDFVFLTSHHLQEPLRKIITFGDLLKVRCGDVLPDEGRGCLVKIQNSAKRMRTLLHDLLDLSCVTTRALPLCATDLTKIIKKVLADLAVQIEDAGAMIEIDNLATIPVDASQIGQLFRNLVSNSLKFTGAEKPLIKIYGRYTEDKSRYQIFVEDNGIGFDQVYLDKIFTPFQRLHGRLAYEGAGMGLAICRKIMERHEGSITAQSRPDAGATFTLTFPVNLLRALRSCAPRLSANQNGPESGKRSGRRTVS